LPPAVYSKSEKRLLKLNLKLKPYASIIAGYVEAVPDNDDPWTDSNASYLSHFFILCPDSETMPL